MQYKLVTSRDIYEEKKHTTQVCYKNSTLMECTENEFNFNIFELTILKTTNAKQWVLIRR